MKELKLYFIALSQTGFQNGFYSSIGLNENIARYTLKINLLTDIVSSF